MGKNYLFYSVIIIYLNLLKHSTEAELSAIESIEEYIDC